MHVAESHNPRILYLASRPPEVAATRHTQCNKEGAGGERRLNAGGRRRLQRGVRV